MLVGNQQRLYDFVSAHPKGVNREQIKEALYWDDPNGGPEDLNSKIVPVMVWQINKKIKQFKQKISSKGGPHAVYRLVELCSV